MILKKGICSSVLLLVALFVYCDIPKESFSVKSLDNKITITLGDPIETIFHAYGKRKPIIREYSNRSLFEYCYDGFTVSTSSGQWSFSDAETTVLGIEITKPVLVLRDGFTIGSKKNDVATKYGIPEFSESSSIYYINQEWDMMVIEFKFDEKEEVILIMISMGT